MATIKHLVDGASLLRIITEKVTIGTLHFVINIVLELTKYLDSPEFNMMCEHIDPISYKERLSLPKV